MKIAIISSYLPRKCGIATFANDLYKSLSKVYPKEVGIIAISDASESIFPNEVVCIIEKENQSSYQSAAEFINQNYDVCIIQHEYGIFGGNSGYYIVELLKELQIPTLTNLHTILKKASNIEQTIIQELALFSSRITVMTQSALDILASNYSLSNNKINLIPHGVPSFNTTKKDAKKTLGFSDKKIILSFGFLGPNKGYETALDALANVNELNYVYIILGTTHPNILKTDGEKYRELLEKKVVDLNLQSKVIFVNQFADEDLLGQYLKACDIFVSPYPHKNQISSGTLTFALGAGATVVSTPYWYAIDLLADERGLLFDFGDDLALSRLILKLLYDEDLLHYYSDNALSYTKSMQWPKIGVKVIQLINDIIEEKSMVDLSIINAKAKLISQNK